MSQKMGKRTRKNAEDSLQTIKKREETEENAEKKTDDANNETTDKNIEKCKNDTEIINHEVESNTKAVEDIVVPTETVVLEENSQSAELQLQCKDIDGTESCEQNDKGEPEQIDSENAMEPLVLTQESNGVQILVENKEEITDNVEIAIEQHTKELEQSSIVVEEKIVNGETYSDLEAEKDEVSEKIIEPENNITEDIDGKNHYNLEDVNQTEHLEPEIYSETLSEISTQAVVGSDSTRCDENFEYSKFLTMSKDQTVGKSLRHLSARRSIRTTKSCFPVDGNIYNLHQSDIRKRKNCEDESYDMKRTKTDSPGLMSYFGYPFKKSDVASSTPKLTGYRVNSFDSNVSKISLDNSNEKDTNKWCSVM